jgi:hypothetical protein
MASISSSAKRKEPGGSSSWGNGDKGAISLAVNIKGVTDDTPFSAKCSGFHQSGRSHGKEKS